MPALQITWQFLMILLLCFLIFLVAILAKTLYNNLKYSESIKKKEIEKQSFGEIISKHRNDCKMTIEYVAKHLGVSSNVVSKWENGKLYPSNSNLIALAKLFGITVEELLKEIEDNSQL